MNSNQNIPNMTIDQIKAQITKIEKFADLNKQEYTIKFRECERHNKQLAKHILKIKNLRLQFFCDKCEKEMDQEKLKNKVPKENRQQIIAQTLNELNMGLCFAKLNLQREAKEYWDKHSQIQEVEGKKIQCIDLLSDQEEDENQHTLDSDIQQSDTMNSCQILESRDENRKKKYRAKKSSKKDSENKQNQEQQGQEDSVQQEQIKLEQQQHFKKEIQEDKHQQIQMLNQLAQLQQQQHQQQQNQNQNQDKQNIKDFTFGTIQQQQNSQDSFISDCQEIVSSIDKCSSGNYQQQQKQQQSDLIKNKKQDQRAYKKNQIELQNDKSHANFQEDNTYIKKLKKSTKIDFLSIYNYFQNKSEIYLITTLKKILELGKQKSRDYFDVSEKYIELLIAYIRSNKNHLYQKVLEKQLTVDNINIREVWWRGSKRYQKNFIAFQKSHQGEEDQ